MTQFRIPKRYRSARNNRMSWYFVFKKDGSIRERIRNLGFYPGVEHPDHIVRLLELFLPHRIIAHESIHKWEDEEYTKQQDEWFRENITGCWQLWGFFGESRLPIYFFENEADAVLFKLRWA